MVRGMYPPLPAKLLRPGASFFSPMQVLPERVGLEHPASAVMTDLKQVSAVVIRPDDTVDEAHRRMIQRGVRLLLVLDPERRVVGLLTATDILGEKPMKVVAERGCRHGDILVSDIMTPQERLEVLDMADVATAREQTSGAPEVVFAPPWFEHPGFVAAAADGVSHALAQVPADERSEAPLVFTAHSVPVAMAEASPYVADFTAAPPLG